MGLNIAMIIQECNLLKSVWKVLVHIASGQSLGNISILLIVCTHKLDRYVILEKMEVFDGSLAQMGCHFLLVKMKLKI